ncbi:TauD/TfdA family dioxygenase [Actinoplanes sp. NPDC051346]|uniref:TauD/TfdA family dioxygenase n=1 Tax=Actinoplanes sp. NPDC051346 TaxID=3155048 RepID=UPI00342B3190
MSLSDTDRLAVGVLAENLSATAPSMVDDLDWLAAARRMSCSLPPALGEGLRQFRHDPGAEGLLSITNLPIDGTVLPPTPAVADSVQRAGTVPAAVALLLGLHLGEVIAYREEKQGALVQDVVPVPSLAASQSNGGSVPLELHTENAFHPNRPDYVGLLCLRGASDDVGTLVCSIRRALAVLEEPDLTTLAEPRFVTASPPSFRSGAPASAHAILSGAADDPDLRVDFNATTAVDDEARQALRRLRDAMMAVKSSVVLVPGQMVFLDNRIVVHGRSGFTPRYDGADRWLHRIFVHLDNRRGRERRDGNGAVLS